MSLKFSILGFLDLMPLSGYDLSKMFASSVNYYWPATHTQIYKTLKQLYREDLIDLEVIEQSEHPDKKLYRINEKGRSHLRIWLKDASGLPTIRQPLLVKIAFASLIDHEQFIGLLNDYVHEIKERLAMYKGENQEKQLEIARSERERFFWGLLLDNGIKFFEGELKWAENAISEYKKNFM